MATRKRRVRPLRSLIGLIVLAAIIFGGIGANAKWGGGSMAPGLALDLEGGTQLILTPTAGHSKVSSDQIDEAIRIMRQRVNATGVSEAEISSQGGSNIVVKLPGHPSEETIKLVQSSAQLSFRAVLTAGGPGPITPEALEQMEQQEQAQQGNADSDKASGDQDNADSDKKADKKKAAGGTVATQTGGSTDTPSQPADSSSEDAGDDATAGDEGAATSATPAEIKKAAKKAADVDGDGKISDKPTKKPESGSDQAWITEQVLYDFYTLDCTDPKNLAGGMAGDADKALAACGSDGSAKYILGPTELKGTEVASANSALEVNQGVVTNNYIVELNFTSEGGKKFAAVTKRLASMAASGQNRFGIVLDGLVISAPSVSEQISGGKATISGSDANPFTKDETVSLANQLNYGALPITFELRSQSDISATLGSEQLQRGLLAGLIGLILVVGYCLIQYRGLAIVTLMSLVIAGALTYGSITALSELIGYRLSLAGVAGLIVAVGITADSFIVYFERIRDEVREGRRLEDAVELGWSRAKQTILASDAVNLVAAIVLYVLAVGGVRGFAFTLGLTTIIDVIVVILFTHPSVQLLVRTEFFGNGHKLSGLDPLHLGSKVPIYRGRGRIRSGESIAERRRAAQKAAESANSPESDDGRSDPQQSEASLTSTNTEETN